MLPKAAAIDSALANGVNRVHVISYKVPDSLLLEVFTNEGTGTLVVNDVNALTPAEQAGRDALAVHFLAGPILDSLDAQGMADL